MNFRRTQLQKANRFLNNHAIGHFEEFAFTREQLFENPEVENLNLHNYQSKSKPRREADLIAG